MLECIIVYHKTLVRSSVNTWKPFFVGKFEEFWLGLSSGVADSGTCASDEIVSSRLYCIPTMTTLPINSLLARAYNDVFYWLKLCRIQEIVTPGCFLGSTPIVCG